MITFLSKLFIKHHDDYKSPTVRFQYGILCSSVGIFFNISLFIFKFLAGIISGSIAITADALNNLSDAGSSLITFLGFRLAKSTPDLDHPYGHGRIEYLSGLVVSVLILYMGFELLTSSIGQIFHPNATSYSPIVFIILLTSLAVKGYMFFYNNALSVKISSASLKAIAMDSLSDMISTSVILICSLISHFFEMHLEGYCGTFVGVLILYAGYQTAKDTISPLLGKAPEPEMVENIRSIVLSGQGILAIHDLMVHDYGLGRLFISLHAEVPADGDIMLLHDSIDAVERRLENELHCKAVIHMDPIHDKDEFTIQCRENIEAYLTALSTKISVHDFRIVKRTTHTKLIFDVLSPYDCPIPDEVLLSELKAYIASLEGNCHGVITLDKI
jgi:cation diffusion facilitator family transporter